MNYRDQLEEDVKKILGYEFSIEKNKKRLMDPDKNKELVNLLGDALSVIESQTIDKLCQYLDGDDIEVVVPTDK